MEFQNCLYKDWLKDVEGTEEASQTAHLQPCTCATNSSIPITILFVVLEHQCTTMPLWLCHSSIVTSQQQLTSQQITTSFNRLLWNIKDFYEEMESNEFTALQIENVQAHKSTYTNKNVYSN